MEFIVIVKVCTADESIPPFATPPLSLAFTETVATPEAAKAGSKTKLPAASTDG